MPGNQPVTADFHRLRKVLLRQGEPDRVPLYEGNINRSIKEEFLGQPIRTIAEEAKFWAMAGYDHIPIPIGVRQLVRTSSAPSTGLVGRKRIAAGTTSDSAGTDRVWAQEGQGIITDWSSFQKLDWPSLEDFDFQAFERLSRDLPRGMKIIPMMGYVFAASWMLMGFEGYCLALIEQSDLVAALCEKLATIQAQIHRYLLEHYSSCIGAIAHPDDVAYTESLMVSPEHLTQHVFPQYQQMNKDAHAHDLPVIYHSDGQLHPILEDIVQCGFDALHPIEPKAMDIVQLKKDVGSRLCLLGGLDLGEVLARGTPEEVSNETKRLLRRVAPGGGYGLGSSNSVPDYVPFANYQAMRETTLAFGRYPLDE